MSEKEETAITKAEVQAPEKRLSISESMAHQYGMESGPFMEALMKVVFPREDRKGQAPTNAQVIAYMAVCQRYGLDPFTRMLWPFPMKDGGFMPAAGYDGWLYIMNNHPAYAGDEYEEIRDKDGSLIAGEVKIYRKDRDKPTVKRCKLSEWDTGSNNWKTQQSHMMELRTYCQGIRKAFGISGIHDTEDLERIDAARDITKEATEMQRETLTKTEQLKEKLNGKKDKELPPAQQEGPEKTEPSETPPPPTVEPEQPTAPPMESNGTSPIDPGPLPFDDAPALPAETQPEDPEANRPVSEEERQSILAILQAKCKTQDEHNKAMLATATKLEGLGLSSSRELPKKHLQEMLDWAKNLKL